jgi:hypothetical protein
MQDYDINDVGVAMNPIVVWISNEYDITWDYSSITIAQIEEKWYYGLSAPGMGSPCMKCQNSYNTKEDAIVSAYSYLKDRLENYSDLGIKHNGKKQLKELIAWWDSRGNEQLELF